MPAYGDPEVLVGEWLEAKGFQVRADPDIRADYWAAAPLVHLQRGQSLSSLALSLDDATLDIDVYSAVADHAREVAHQVWSAMLLDLPKTTFSTGIFVTGTSVITAPFWAPDPSVKRRSASYRVILHGFTA